MPVLQESKHISWHGPANYQGSVCSIWTFCQHKQEGLVEGVCWCSMTSVKLSADSVDEEKKNPMKAGNDSFWKWSWLTGPSIRRCSAKESSVLSKRIVDSKQKNRRCYEKESTMLRGSSQYTLRYHLTAMYREVVIREKHSRIIVFPLGFREVFSLLPCLYGSTCPNRESNTCKVDVWSAFRTDCCCL